MSISMRLLVGLVIALGLFVSGYLWGDHSRDNAWVAKQAKSALQAQKKFDAEVVRGNDAVAGLKADQSDLQTRYYDLEGKFNAKAKHVPLVASCNAAADPKADGPSGAELVAVPAAAPVVAASGVPDPVVPVLSNAAVWMWDSALAGRDLSTSACGSADTSDTACAAASGITLQDAWRNHEVNARSCAVDRLRYQRLINFLKGKSQ